VDIQLYIQEEKDYKEQSKSIQLLQKWVIDSVASHFVRVACKPEDNLHQWYNNLKSRVGITKSRGIQIAYEQYQKALKPLTKAKDWSDWLKTWEKAMIIAEEKELPEALSTYSWTREFFTAVTPVADQWAITYQLTHEEQIEKGQVTVGDIARAFHMYMTKPQPQRVIPRVAKGAFPTYAGQDTPDQSTLEDAQDPAKGARRNRSKHGVLEEDTSVEDTCEACDQSHPVARCYYIFPDKSPHWWKENPEIRTLVDSRLEKDTNLRGVVQRLRGKRSRSGTPRTGTPRSGTPRGSWSRRGSRTTTPVGSRSNTPCGAKEDQNQDQDKLDE
jgi:hypothetical protein